MWCNCQLQWLGGAAVQLTNEFAVHNSAFAWLPWHCWQTNEDSSLIIQSAQPILGSAFVGGGGLFIFSADIKGAQLGNLRVNGVNFNASDSASVELVKEAFAGSTAAYGATIGTIEFTA
jgi:hypothetical protein